MNIHTLRQNLILKVLFISLILSLSGCVYLIVGGIGAFGGYVVSPDTVEGITHQESLTVWDASVEIISIMGIIEEQHEDGGIILARINGAKVTVTLTTINQDTTQVSVKARKSVLPSIKTAQNVYVKIMSYLNE